VAKGTAEVGSTTNSYQILGRLAVGGMAEIFLARGAGGAGVERYCVLKRILRERAGDAQFVQMFLDEAKLAAQLQHPNIASVYDIGMLGDSYFFTMEYVHGETVRSLLHRALELCRPLPLACVLTIIAGTSAGLHHAHERKGNDGRPLGIVHRDISPSNLMVGYEGNVKIVDFGVAKADDRAVQTQSGTVKGKIGYLSPEQCRGQRVDRRSDLFSLGIVMWEMLTGTRLYRRDSDFENMEAIVHELPPPPSSRRPEVPRTVDDIVLRLLAKSAADRFQTAHEVIEAIEHVSLRAGMILSASAVSRLVRDRFGTRAEPWLELDGEPLRRRTVTLGARPIARARAPAAADPAEAELAAIADLSTSSMPDRADPAVEPSGTPALAGAAVAGDRMSLSISTWKDAPRAGAGREEAPRSRHADPAQAPAPAPAATRPHHEDRAVAHAAMRPPSTVPFAAGAAGRPSPFPRAAVTSRMAGVVVPPRRAAPGAARDPRSAPSGAPAPLAVAAPSATSLREPASIGVVGPPAMRRNPPTAGEPVMPVRPLATRPPTDLAAMDPDRALAVRAARLGSPTIDEVMAEAPAASAAPSAAAAARTGDARGTSRATLRDAGQRRTSRAVHRLLAICALGGIIGWIAVWLSALSHEGSAPAGEPARRVEEDTGTAAAEPARPHAAAPLPRDASDAIDGSEADVRHASDALDGNKGGNEGGNEVGLAAGPSTQLPDDASQAAPRKRSRRPSRKPPPSSAEPPPQLPEDAGASAVLSPSQPVPDSPTGESTSPPLSPAADNTARELLNDLFHLGEYETIVRSCSGMTVSADTAVVCILAACSLGASDKVKLWLPRVAEERRVSLLARCNELNTGQDEAPGTSGSRGNRAGSSGSAASP
jgi:serine/threonine-protein kinase